VRVVVTGGAGFIGGNLCRLLVDRDHDVVVVDDLSTGSRANLDGVPVELIDRSVLDADAVAAAVAGVGSVVHLAAKASVMASIDDPATTYAVNVTGTLHVLEAARAAGVDHVVVASSAAVYGTSPTVPSAETLPPAPPHPYGASKLATETMALAHGRAYGMRVLALRFFNVFGPLQPVDHVYAAAVPAFVDAAVHDRPIPIHGDGLQTRDFVDVDHVVDVLATAAERRIAHDGPVNLAGGQERTLLELVTELEAVVGRSLAVEHLPPRPADPRRSRADVSVLRSLLPDLVPSPLGVALGRTLAWFDAMSG
jgi:UDP-glucose 4-epimerase